MSIMDTLHQDRDKVLLFLMFVLLLFAAIHFVHHAADSRVLDWTLQAAAGVLGSLITLITGRGSAQRTTDKPPEGKP